MFLTIFTSDIH